MVKKRYDVIIVGAGVSGLMLSNLLNRSKLKVLLIESRRDIKKLNNHKYGTFGKTIKKFCLDKYVTNNYSKFGFHGPKNETICKYNKTAFQVVDMNQFAKSLKLKCDVKTNYFVKKVKRIKDAIMINNEFEGKIVVDCSGNKKVIASKLGLLKKSTIDMFSTSYEMIDCNISKDRLDEFWFMVDLNYTNVGLWFYPYSKNKCQIGQTDFYSKKLPLIRNQKKSLEAYIKNISPYKKWLKNAKITEVVRKTGPTTTISAHFHDNFLACGDAAGAGTPIAGEGFRIALEMALSAKETIDIAFERNNFSKKILKKHKNNFKKIREYYVWSNLLRFFILNSFTNKEYDEFAKNLKKLSSKELYSAVRSEFTLKIILKTITIKMFLGMIKNTFKKIIGKNLNKRIIK